MNKKKQFRVNALDPSELSLLFKLQLNTMHEAVNHLAANLPQLARLTSFVGLKLALEESLDDALKQLTRIQVISTFFKNEFGLGTLGMKALIDETYVMISKTAKLSYERDMSLIFYMHIIKNIEITAYRTLRLTAAKLGYSQAKTLLAENMDEEVANNKLFTLISNEYLPMNDMPAGNQVYDLPA